MEALKAIRLPRFRHPSSSVPSAPSEITPAPDLAWELVGDGRGHLLRELETLYWEAVKAEVENIVHTLKAWQKPELASLKIKDETDRHIHGFDTFLDNVSQETRAFAIRYGTPAAHPKNTLAFIVY